MTQTTEAWKIFRFTHGVYGFHHPSAHLVAFSGEMGDMARDPSRAPEINSVLKGLESSMPTALPREAPPIKISAIALNVAQSCNLRCTYCFAGDGDYGNASRMTWETAKDVIDFFLRQAPTLHIHFFGGEPMLNFPLIKQVVTYGAELGDGKLSYGITTNGTMLQRAHLDFFREHEFVVKISYDGDVLQQKQRLNRDRRTNSADVMAKKLIDFRADLDELENFALRGTVEKANLDLAEEAMVQTLTSHNYRMQMARHAGSDGPTMFTMEDAKRLGAVIERVVTRLLDADDFATLLRFDNIARYLSVIHHGRRQQMACAAGVSYLSVATDGNFYLCHRFTEDKKAAVGSATDGLNTEMLQSFAEHRTARAEPCRSCWMRNWCAGGCFHENAAANGSFFAIDPVYCTIQSFEISQAIRVYTCLKERFPEQLKTIAR